MRVPSLLLLSASLCITATASAQQPNARVRDLNRQAIEAYQQLDIERAEALLTQAQEECEHNACLPADRARSLANLGIVAYGGAGDAGRASALFRRAIEADPAVQLDPLITTPEIDLLFQRARAEASSSSVTGGAGGVNLSHVPPAEQLVHTALPLYVEVPADMSVGRMELRYKGNGMRRFAALPMEPMVDGFGVELACEHVFEPGISYYFIAYDSAGRTIRTVGTEQDPFRVPIVASRTQQPPALPGRAPPEACNLDECPPDIDCTSGNASSSGNSGTSGSSSGSSSSTTDEADANQSTMRYFVEVGPVLSMAHGRDDMRAADVPPNLTDPRYDGYIQGGNPGCTLSPSQYCVRVTQNGSAFAWGVHLAAGMYFTERFGMGITARIAPQSGGGTLSHGLIGLRLQYRIVVPRPEGLYVTAHVGASVGQIQIQPKQEARMAGQDVVRPWAQTGLAGVSVGGTVGFHFSPSIGVFLTPEFYAMFPNTGIGGNFTLGMDFAFGEVGGSGAPEEEEEAPRPAGDRDRDTVMDPVDRCPDQPEDLDQFADEDGCPDTDDDMDTILDANDGCKMEPEDMDGFEDGNGCPDPDNDGDTVLDAADRCPMERGPTSNNGCPEPDRDGDTVIDRTDNCPDEPGTVENQGCAARQLVVIEGDHLQILEKVYFRTNSHVIDRRSFTLLDNVASVLMAHPEITMIHIEGHTDSRGNAARNRTLSTRRANSVREYLVRRGLNPTRLTSQGFGPDQPVFPGATTDAEHEANRRVEFRLEMGGS